MCVFLYNPILFYSVSLIYFFRAATAFDIFGNDNAEELLTCGFQYPSLPISILHFVARIFGRKWYNFALLNTGESGKHRNLQVVCLLFFESFIRTWKKKILRYDLKKKKFQSSVWRKKKIQSSVCCVLKVLLGPEKKNFFVTTWKKKSSSRLSGKKKRYSRLSVVFWKFY